MRAHLFDRKFVGECNTVNQFRNSGILRCVLMKMFLIQITQPKTNTNKYLFKIEKRDNFNIAKLGKRHKIFHK